MKPLIFVIAKTIALVRGLLASSFAFCVRFLVGVRVLCCDCITEGIRGSRDAFARVLFGQ